MQNAGTNYSNRNETAVETENTNVTGNENGIANTEMKQQLKLIASTETKCNNELETKYRNEIATTNRKGNATTEPKCKTKTKL